MESREGVSALDLYKQEFSDSYRAIPTFVQPLDAILGGGIKPGMITELVGDSGIGKTSMCLQLCLDVQIPQYLQGLEAEALYIDTENTLAASRIEDMSRAFVNHCNSINPKGRGKKMSLRRVLSRIHIVKPRDPQQFLKIIASLTEFVSRNRTIRLVVIDSIAMPFYTQGEDFWKRVKPLYRIGQELHYIAGELGVAVVVTNNLTTRFNEVTGEKYYVPYLGDTWFNVPNQRINMYWAGTPRVRVAELVKSQCAAKAKAHYKVAGVGVRE